MYATAAEAIEKGLRHKRTGEILATKNVARNTKLVYLDDDCVGLQFHNTIIARYERDHVKLDTRDRHLPRGWFTVTTWDRIDAFTPARTFQSKGLRHIMLDPYTGTWSGRSQLYTHGAIVSPDGSCEVPNLAPEQSDAIIAAKSSLPRKVRAYTNKLVKAWREWQTPKECCEIAAVGNVPLWEHLFTHFRTNEVAILPNAITEAMLSDGRQRVGLDPDRLAHELAEKVYDRLKSEFLPLAIAHVAPDFPYPQIAPRRR